VEYHRHLTERLQRAIEFRTRGMRNTDAHLQVTHVKNNVAS
jgi:hypothetical protein